MNCILKPTTISFFAAFITLILLPHAKALAHCDAMDGPVVLDAQKALADKNVTPVLKWIKEAQEQQIRKAFQDTLAVGTKGEEVKELAETYFFETLVRLHRASEGMPYTGLKPAGTHPGPGVEAADEALEKDDVDTLIKKINARVAEGIRKRYEDAKEAKTHAADSVNAGRKFVTAYVHYTHYVRGISQAAAEGSHNDHPE
jgi:hypothetical protein